MEDEINPIYFPRTEALYGHSQVDLSYAG